MTEIIEEISVEEKIKDEEWYLDFCTVRLNHLLLKQKELKYSLTFDLDLARSYLPFDIDDMYSRIELCKQRLENLKKHGDAFPRLSYQN